MRLIAVYRPPPSQAAPFSARRSAPPRSACGVESERTRWAADAGNRCAAAQRRRWAGHAPDYPLVTARMIPWSRLGSRDRCGEGLCRGGEWAGHAQRARGQGRGQGRCEGLWAAWCRGVAKRGVGEGRGEGRGPARSCHCRLLPCHASCHMLAHAKLASRCTPPLGPGRGLGLGLGLGLGFGLGFGLGLG